VTEEAGKKREEEGGGDQEEVVNGCPHGYLPISGANLKS